MSNSQGTQESSIKPEDAQRVADFLKWVKSLPKTQRYAIALVIGITFPGILKDE